MYTHLSTFWPSRLVGLWTRTYLTACIVEIYPGRLRHPTYWPRFLGLACSLEQAPHSSRSSLHLEADGVAMGYDHTGAVQQGLKLNVTTDVGPLMTGARGVQAISYGAFRDQQRVHVCGPGSCMKQSSEVRPVQQVKQPNTVHWVRCECAVISPCPT
jgi:hypothetical protein